MLNSTDTLKGGSTAAAMQDMTVARYRTQRQRAREQGLEATGLSPFNTMMRGLHPRVVEQIKKRSRRKAGRSLAGVVDVRQAKPEVATLIALRTIFDGISSTPGVASIAAKIGTRLEDELQFAKFRKEDRPLFNWAMNAKNTEVYHRKTGALRRAIHISDKATEWEAWGTQRRVAAGLFLIECVLEVEPKVIQRGQKPTRRAPMATLELTAEAAEACREMDAQYEFLRPWYLPTTTPPLDWHSEVGGGYDPELFNGKNFSLVKSKGFHAVEQGDMPVVYAAVNDLQRTAWRVNEDVLVVAQELYRAGGEVPGMPSVNPRPQPIRPSDITMDVAVRDLPPEQQAEMRAWKRAMSDYYSAEAARKGRILAVRQMLDVANMLKAEEALYFPHQLDWRGRAYAMPLLLQPQGRDLARGLLTFATAEPVGPHGGRWLAIHGANLFGQDKIPFNQRVAWVDANVGRILAVNDDPLTETWWQEADSPWQFLAWCLEWARYEESGRSTRFGSSLPVLMDGSCNGLQHFSAMLRDEVGGAAVNLVPSDRPQDIYARVARHVDVAVEQDAIRLDERGRLARELRAGELLNRSTVKRPVMTLPYGVTQIGMRGQLARHFFQTEAPLGDHRVSAKYLAPIVWEAIGLEVRKALEAMAFLQALARDRGQKYLPIEWVTPAGFRVLQKYRSERSGKVRSQLLGHIRVKIPTQKMDRRKQVNGVAPNLVHSLDAAHMMLTMRRMPGAAWHMVHDCFGTHAGGAQRLADVLREEFVRMYEAHDVLAELVQHSPFVGEPLPLPCKGALDLSETLASPYFFG